MEYKNKRKTEGTKQQQNHRTQEWTNSYQRERDWEEQEAGRDKGREEKGGIMISMYNVEGGGKGRALQHREDK